MFLLTAVLKDRDVPIQLFDNVEEVKAYLFDNPIDPATPPTDRVLAVVRSLKIPYDWDDHKQGKPGWACRGV